MATIHWFRRDLRLEDNLALVQAVHFGDVIPVFIWQDESLGERSRSWLHHSLCSLNHSLKKKGSFLVVKKGKPLDVLRQLIKKYRVNRIVWNRCYESDALSRDAHIKKVLKEEGIVVETFNSALLMEPWEMVTGKGGPFLRYFSFWNALQKKGRWSCVKAPERISSPFSLTETWKEDEAPFLGWNVGERYARLKWKHFLDHHIHDYAVARDRVDLEAGASRMSPHLHFGEISPRQMWLDAERKGRCLEYMKELAWREFSYHLLYAFPHLSDQSLQEAFGAFPWNDDQKGLQAWKEGKTGYPIVDAAMRQLLEIGWMPNRLRMVVASFLTKHLLIPWQEGAAWFLEKLVDADLAINSFNWQWVAGCGMDAAPYFRIFNPKIQSKKCDPEGLYIQQWVPELRRLSAKAIHHPEKAEAKELVQAKVDLGSAYPFPIVDHEYARRRALKGFEKVKKCY